MPEHAQSLFIHQLLRRVQEGQPYSRYGAADVGSDASRATNAIAAREGLVLLANPAERPPLPFSRHGGGATVVVGFAGNSSWPLAGSYVSQYCLDGSGDCFPGLTAAIAALGETVAFAPGCTSAANCSAEQVNRSSSPPSPPISHPILNPVHLRWRRLLPWLRLRLA